MNNNIHWAKKKFIARVNVMSICILTVVCISLCSSCSSLITSNTHQEKLVPVTIKGKDLFPYGRTRMTIQGLELISSGVHFGINFSGKELELTATLPDWLDHNYLQYEIDGIYKKRIRINKGSAKPIIISADTDGKHTVRIFKATEAHTGPIFIQEIKAVKARAIKVENKPLIEFIGNSITCGAASDFSEISCGEGDYHDNHNSYLAYGLRVARALGSNFILSSVSGIGIYRNWNSDGPTMPQVYRKTSFQNTDTAYWDFKQYRPKVVSIALGTNDLSDGDGKNPRLLFNRDTFISTYVKFVDSVKYIYPEAQIALLSSPMMRGEKRDLLQKCLEKVKETVDKKHPADKPIALHIFKEMQARGCTGHPSVADHKIMADELIPFFRDLIK